MNLFWLYLFETIGQEIMAMDYFIFLSVFVFIWNRWSRVGRDMMAIHKAVLIVFVSSVFVYIWNRRSRGGRDMMAIHKATHQMPVPL